MIIEKAAMKNLLPSFESDGLIQTRSSLIARLRDCDDSLAWSEFFETYWRFSAMHCDGFSDDTGPGGNCFPAGETQLPTMAFDVTPGRY